MGYLLKEALKALCGVNQWDYAVLWKIACQNPKLLIWEECYYEPILCSNHPKTSELPFGEWGQCLETPEVQSRSRIQLLIGQMMVKNQVNIMGEGVIGRAAFTGNHQWILSESFRGDSHPPEVSNEMQNQFSAGILTVAVIPVSPHGVVQLGSSLSITENTGFVNHVRSLIFQLGCIPNALFSDNYAAKAGSPVSFGMPYDIPSENCELSGLVGNAHNILNPSVYQNSNRTKICHPKVDPVMSTRPPFQDRLESSSWCSSSIPMEKQIVADVIGPNLQQFPDSMLNGLSISRGSCLHSEVECPKNEHGRTLTRPPPSLRVHRFEKQDPRSPSTVTNPQYEEVSFQPHSSGDDLFDVLGVELKNKILGGNFHSLCEKGKEIPTPINEESSDFYAIPESLYDDGGIFSGMSTDDHLLDAVVSRAHSVSNPSSDDNLSCKTTLTKTSTSSVPSKSPTFPGINMSPEHIEKERFKVPKPLEIAGNPVSPSTSFYGSQISSWVEQSHSVKLENSVSTGYSKRPDGVNKSNRKRLKPGENPRPRPKDRQMIQDRVKELREIVPNGAKCSIDALLERTIKHMLFLQSVTKHADQLKESGESKIVNKEGGLLLKDNFEGGATWAFEVGSQSMVCPIVVEDLNPPRQMLVEMLCEDRGLFLEIAEMVRGLGLTILKGVMEARNNNIWARFAVEANRDVTRMEIFMSLVRLLDQTPKSNGNYETIPMDPLHAFTQPASIPATCGPH